MDSIFKLNKIAAPQPARTTAPARAGMRAPMRLSMPSPTQAAIGATVAPRKPAPSAKDEWEEF